MVQHLQEVYDKKEKQPAKERALLGSKPATTTTFQGSLSTSLSMGIFCAILSLAPAKITFYSAYSPDGTQSTPIKPAWCPIHNLPTLSSPKSAISSPLIYVLSVKKKDLYISRVPCLFDQITC